MTEPLRFICYGAKRLGRTAFWGKVSLANVIGRYFHSQHFLNPLQMFNYLVLEHGTGNASQGMSLRARAWQSEL
ncbi:MAG: hypothetical protein WBA93_36265 [Microcoleaceae cyanobacterium]